MIRQQSSRICILTGLCLMTYGCGAENPGEASKAPQLQGAILIVLDTVRADHVSCYGHDRPTTPALDGLADAGVRFEQVVSNSPWTLPAVVGLLTGEYPRRTFRERMSRSLVEVFQRAGLATGASTEGGFVSRHFGLDLGFDHFEEEEGNVQLWIEDREPEPDPEGGIEHTFDRARKWLAVHRDERFSPRTWIPALSARYSPSTSCSGSSRGRSP